MCNKYIPPLRFNHVVLLLNFFSVLDIVASKESESGLIGRRNVSSILYFSNHRSIAASDVHDSCETH